MIDSNFINPFLGSTLDVLKVQAGIIAEPCKPVLKKPDEPLQGDVSGVIDIVSHRFNGCVIISFPQATFLKVMSGMLGEEFTEMGQEIVDGASEITNMIFGQSKIILNERGYGINIALPQIVTGKGHSLSAMSKGPAVLIPFKSTAGDFFVEICLSGESAS